mmetsp:Transcript_8848/g.14312  ORF Transcript_8848/g.14312 Transcript_8848/m.14312 type:complete len:187 (+) Transcript_8848:3-563(+)
MAMMQLQQSIAGPLDSPSGSSPSVAKLYTCYLPNFMWYQPRASDSSSSSMIRPTSLCSGTGITGDHQYLNPDMLNVLSTFGSYFLGSGYLFQDDNENKDNSKRRTAFWVETIDENDGEDDSMSEETNNSSDSSTSSDCSDSCQIQKDLIERVIEDLRCSQLMMTMEQKIRPGYEIRDKSCLRNYTL